MAKNLCIIPARGGSKRIPRKNIKNFLGKPIIAYSIEAALNSNIFDEVMVSTDDSEIADFSRNLGANIPFMRSSETSGDFATTAAVLREVIEDYEKKDIFFENVCCIYPCAPFVTSKKLINAFNLMQKEKLERVLTVVPFDFPIQRAIKIKNSKPHYLFPEYESCRSQDLEEIYHDAGQFYFHTVKSLKENAGMISDECGLYKIPILEAQDIDVEEDWEFAELKYERLRSKKGLS